MIPGRARNYFRPHLGCRIRWSQLPLAALYAVLPLMTALDLAAEPYFFLDNSNTHSVFSRTVPPVLTVPSGSVVEVLTHEPTRGHFDLDSTEEDFLTFDPSVVHPLTGPVFVEEAEPGDVLAVTLLTVELEDFGWAGIVPGLGVLPDEFPGPYLKTFDLTRRKRFVDFAEGVRLRLKPFPGVLGVAPDTDEDLSTIPPRANGGNLDDPAIRPGTTVYFPVFVPGALFSVGDVHATQGMGELCGTALEARTRVVYRVEVLKDFRPIQEPQYENWRHYAVTAFGGTAEGATRKATRFMVDYLVQVRGLSANDAYVLISLAGDLKVSQLVNHPSVSVSLQISKRLFR